MIFSGYNPFAKKPDNPEIPETVKKAARLVRATHLSADGKIAYITRMGKVCWADWSEKYGCFEAWWEAEKIPEGAIEL